MSEYESVTKTPLRLKKDSGIKKKKKILETFAKVEKTTGVENTQEKKPQTVPLTKAERAFLLMKEKKDQRRQKMTEAAERRLREQERRGLKSDASLQRVKRAKERSMIAEDAREQPNSDGRLRWQVT